MGLTPKKKGKTAQKPRPLPKFVRNDLPTACALKGFIELRSGKSKRVIEQHNQMARFYHGKPPKYPSQIKLLADRKLN